MNIDPKKEEASLQPTPPDERNNDNSDLTLPAKRVKVTVEGLKQVEIDKLVKYLVGMKKRAQKDILHVGGELTRMRHVIPHGRWGRFIEVNFTAVTGLSIKTANIWIRAYENRESELAVNDWDAYMRALYGNEPKKLKGVSYKYQPEEEEEDTDQTGGVELESGHGFNHEKYTKEQQEMQFFAETGKPAIYNLKRLIHLFDGYFLKSKAYTLEEKETFITEAINWLEDQKKNLRA